MPNGRTHEEIGKAAARLVLTCGLTPSAMSLLLEGRPDFIAACSLPDRVDEVACVLPGEGPQTVLLGHNLSSFRHFQVGERGYRWLADDSLSIGGALVAAAGAVIGAQIVEYRNGLRPPPTGLEGATPLERALLEQPGATVGTFRFPSAGEEADHYAQGARYWLANGSPDPARRCAGMVAHLVTDACCPPHGWGQILHGHAAFEDALEAQWHETLAEMIEAEQVADVLAPAVREELADIKATSIEDLCIENSLWTRRAFGEPRDMPECPGDVALRLSVRAVAATLRALELMTEVAS